MAMLTFYNSVLSVDYKYKEYLVLSLVYAVAGIGGSVLLILTLCRGQGYLGRILGTLIPAVLVGHLCGVPPVAEGPPPHQPGILALRHGHQPAHGAPRPEPAAAEPI